VLDTTKLYVTVWPTADTVSGDADLATVRFAVWVAVTVAADRAETTAGPDGGVPVETAESLIDPAVRSAWVTV